MLKARQALHGLFMQSVLVMACGVATYIMFGSTLDSLQQSRSHYYRDYRFADVFATVKRAPQALGQRVQ